MEDTSENIDSNKTKLTINNYRHPKYPQVKIKFEILIDEDKIEEEIRSHPHPIVSHTRDIPTTRQDVTATVTIE